MTRLCLETTKGVPAGVRRTRPASETEASESKGGGALGMGMTVGRVSAERARLEGISAASLRLLLVDVCAVLPDIMRTSLRTSPEVSISQTERKLGNPCFRRLERGVTLHVMYVTPLRALPSPPPPLLDRA